MAVQALRRQRIRCNSCLDGVEAGSLLFQQHQPAGLLAQDLRQSSEPNRAPATGDTKPSAPQTGSRSRLGSGRGVAAEQLLDAHGAEIVTAVLFARGRPGQGGPSRARQAPSPRSCSAIRVA